MFVGLILSKPEKLLVINSCSTLWKLNKIDSGPVSVLLTLRSTLMSSFHRLYSTLESTKPSCKSLLFSTSRVKTKKCNLYWITNSKLTERINFYNLYSERWKVWSDICPSTQSLSLWGNTFPKENSLMRLFKEQNLQKSALRSCSSWKRCMRQF